MTSPVSTRLRRHAGACALLLLAAMLPLATTVCAAPSADLIVRRIDNGERAALASGHARWAKPANDLGRVPADVPLAHLGLTLRRSAERQQAYEALLRDQHDPASPDYRRWLTAAQIGERFGASPHDIDALTGWLRTQGLHVDGVANSRTRIRFSGRAADVAAAFATDLHYFQVGTEKRIANVDTPRVPAALAGAVHSVLGLSTLRFKPLVRAERRQVTSQSASPRPQSTNCAPSGVCSHVIFPADFARIFDIDSLQQQGIDGRGQSIAIIGRARVSNDDITHFQTLAGLASKLPVTIVPPDGIDPDPAVTTCSDTDSSLPSCDDPTDQVGEQSEATLDVQRAGSVAPGATIKLIVSADPPHADGLFTATEYAIDSDPLPANILSMSYGTCEADNVAGNALYIDDLFAQAAMEGISVFVSSGDGGATGCAGLDTPPQPGERVSPNLLCASGHATCVGGTQFADSTNPSAYWSLHDGPGHLSALGYIPEGSWNEPLDDSGATQMAASGGGISTFIDTPAWQTGPGVPGRQGRYTPDIAFPAATGEGYFGCLAAQGGGCVAVNGGYHYMAMGGTSAAAPSMAGVAALLDQQAGSAQGNLNPRLYALAANSGNGVFHDVTVASSGVGSCNVAIPSLCNNSTPGPDGLAGGVQGYPVGPGYDLATGLGSIDVANLLLQWNGPYAAAVNLDQHGLSGAWYNPATSGQGLVVESVRDLFGAGRGGFFGGWFTYDSSAAGGQRWYTIQGEVDATTPSATLPIYLAQGGRFDAAQAVATSIVGQATIVFSDCSHGTLSYVFTDGSGRNGSMPLSRVTSNPTCTQSGDSNAAPSLSALAGAWFDPATGGQGFVFDFSASPNVLFGGWYSFAANASPAGGVTAQRWYTLQKSFGADPTATGDIAIYTGSGGVFNQGGGVQISQVGTAALDFHDCTTATLTYRFSSGENSGRSGSIDLIRLLPPAAGCAY